MVWNSSSRGNKIILLKLSPEEIYVTKDILKLDNKFWHDKISYDFPLINMKLLPQYFYNFFGKPYHISINMVY